MGKPDELWMDGPRRETGGVGYLNFDEPPIVGREIERKQLVDCWQRARQTRGPSLVLLRGASGTGKSRLARWLLRRVRVVDNAEVFLSNHEPRGGPVDGLPRMLGRYFGCIDAPYPAAYRRIANQLTRSGLYIHDEERLRETAAGLAHLVSPATAGTDAQSRSVPDPPDGQALHALCSSFLARLSARAPVAIWFDDVQWGKGSLDFVEYAMGEGNEYFGQCLFVATLRDEELTARPVESVQVAELATDPQVTELTVGPLDASEQRQLIGSVLDLRESLVSRLVDRTEGNPLFLLQILEDWLDRGLLVETDDGWALQRDEAEELPRQLRDVWNRRIDRLLDQFPPEMRSRAEKALEVAAILGKSVDFREWESACSHHDVQIPDLLAHSLLGSQLALELEGGQSWSFVHGMLRESLEQRARDAGRYADHHRACADMLIELYGEEEASVARLASHRYESGSYEQALEPLLEAARQEARAENTLAVSQYLDRYEVSCDALELGPGEPRRLRGDLFRGWCKRFGGDIEGAAESVERLEAHQENLEAEDRAELHRLAASVLFARGEYRESLEASERSLAIYREEQNIKGEARVRERRGHIYRELGELAEAEQEYARELEAAKRLDDDYLAGRALLARGSVVRRRRDISKAEALIRDAIEYFEEVGGQAGLASCANELGEIARYQGRYAESLDCYRRAERLARRSGSSDYRVGSLNVGLTLVMLGRYVEALGLLGELDEACAEQGDRRMMLYVRAGIMAAEMGIGRWTMAEKMLGEVVSEREKLGSQSYDLAELFERCTRLAAAVGRDWLSEVCRELALQQWRGLDRQTRAAEFAEQHSCR